MRRHEQLFARSTLDQKDAIDALLADWLKLERAQDRCAGVIAENQEAAAICAGYPKAGDRILMVLQPTEVIRWREAAIMS